ncbi:MAG: hypothetical protein QM754_03235 [Tepidisphaeraceae bacterium]
MPTIIDYADVLQQATTLGLQSAYYNTGAFTFPRGAAVEVFGWMGPDDASIRPEFAKLAVKVPPPHPANLAAAFSRAWPAVVNDPAWLMPKSHWAFELDHGNGPWLAPALELIGVNPEDLRPRTDGAAIAFSPGEPGLAALLTTLLSNLKTSDFAILFPNLPHLVTVHHHQQLWWQTTDLLLPDLLRALPMTS